MSTQETLKALHKAKVARDKASEAYALAEDAYISALALEGIRTAKVGVSASVSVKGTLVEGNSTKYDTDSARETLTPYMFNLVTKRVIDSAALKSAIELGKLDDATVATFRTVTPNRAYVKLS